MGLLPFLILLASTTAAPPAGSAEAVAPPFSLAAAPGDEMPGQTIPNFPRVVPGPRAFGPDGPLMPELREENEGEDQDERILRPRPLPKPGAAQQKPPEKKPPTPEEKAEALRQALAPKPAVSAMQAQTLDTLFKQLAIAPDDASAQGIASMIEHIWAHSESDTANLLMQRGSAALIAGQYPLALSIFDKLVALKPDWAEAWNKRATVKFKADDLDGAMADVNQVVKLEPRQFNALVGMGLILEKSKFEKRALEVYRKALALNPHRPDLRKIIEDLAIKVEGRDI